MDRPRALPALLVALAAWGGCERGDEDESEGSAPPPALTPGDGREGPTLTYANGHPLNWLTDDLTTIGYEDHLQRIVNDHRVSLGQHALLHDRAMRRAARGHSRHMRPDVHGFFEHENPEGDTAGDRMTRNGIPWAAVGENLAAGPLDAPSAFEAWMASPGHKSNIENASWRRTGIGYQPGAGPDGFATYWTQLFAD